MKRNAGRSHAPGGVEITSRDGVPVCVDAGDVRGRVSSGRATWCFPTSTRTSPSNSFTGARSVSGSCARGIWRCGTRTFIRARRTWADFNPRCSIRRIGCISSCRWDARSTSASRCMFFWRDGSCFSGRADAAAPAPVRVRGRAVHVLRTVFPAHLRGPSAEPLRDGLGTAPVSRHRRLAGKPDDGLATCWARASWRCKSSPVIRSTFFTRGSRRRSIAGSTFGKPRAGSRRWPGLAAMVAGAVGLSAVQLFEGFHAAGVSVRSVGITMDFAGIFSFPPENFLDPARPRFFRRHDRVRLLGTLLPVGGVAFHRDQWVRAGSYTGHSRASATNAGFARCSCWC